MAKSAERRQLTFSNMWHSQQSDLNSPSAACDTVSRATSTHLQQPVTQLVERRQLTFSNLWQSQQSESTHLQ
ncbi:hypothetical protein DPMN_074362 [Dreissena polymorpha]|uniref:Uncharacterized protein n=1 Tax=Dreissena polymorpha TaxID=45954 RepID=A0A9D4BNA5_DREPO|nr:hypothetical protein DPMN_074362 [Dreissena polymorpha]